MATVGKFGRCCCACGVAPIQMVAMVQRLKKVHNMGWKAADPIDPQFIGYRTLTIETSWKDSRGSTHVEVQGTWVRKFSRIVSDDLLWTFSTNTDGLCWSRTCDESDGSITTYLNPALFDSNGNFIGSSPAFWPDNVPFIQYGDIAGRTISGYGTPLRMSNVSGGPTVIIDSPTVKRDVWKNGSTIVATATYTLSDPLLISDLVEDALAILALLTAGGPFVDGEEPLTLPVYFGDPTPYFHFGSIQDVVTEHVFCPHDYGMEDSFCLLQCRMGDVGESKIGTWPRLKLTGMTPWETDINPPVVFGTPLAFQDLFDTGPSIIDSAGFTLGVSDDSRYGRILGGLIVETTGGIVTGVLAMKSYLKGGTISLACYEQEAKDDLVGAPAGTYAFCGQSSRVFSSPPTNSPAPDCIDTFDTSGGLVIGPDVRPGVVFQACDGPCGNPCP